MKVTVKEYNRLMRMRDRIFDYEDYIDDLKIKYLKKRERIDWEDWEDDTDNDELPEWFREVQTHLNCIMDLMMQMDDWENA